MVDKEVDVLIVGGGLVGAMLMLALAETNLSTLMIEARMLTGETKNDFDARTLALSPASVRVLQALSVWPLLQDYLTPIQTIHVSEQGVFGCGRLHGRDDHPLGYVVEMQHIGQALYQLIDKQRIMAPAQCLAFDQEQRLVTIKQADKEVKIRAKLIVAADGADSVIRQFCPVQVHTKDYQQQAIIANIALARSHQQQAFERFTSIGPMALLPMTNNRAALIWSMSTERAEQMLTISDADFLKQLQQAFGYRLGRLTQVGQRTAYPLRQITLSSVVSDAVVFVGNAAHTLHPIAGQGFNLGLRDIAMLAQCITQHGINDEMLNAYQRVRQYDQTAITRFTDGLIELFQYSFPGSALARGLGLIAFDNIPFLKRILSRYARGFAGITPDLVCGIPLGSMHESV